VFSRKQFVPPAVVDAPGVLTAVANWILGLEVKGTLVDDYEQGTSTPTVTSGTGTLTTKSATLTYTKNGRLVSFRATITITTNGTGGTYIQFTLPFTAAVRTAVCGQSQSAVVGLTGYVMGSNCIIFTAAGGYPAADGYVLDVQGNFEV
jgi:hypothetical protein